MASPRGRWRVDEATGEVVEESIPEPVPEPEPEEEEVKPRAANPGGYL